MKAEQWMKDAAEDDAKIIAKHYTGRVAASSKEACLGHCERCNAVCLSQASPTINRAVNERSGAETTPREHICEAEIFERGPSDGYAKDGERWTCSCGKIYKHSCDEANGCQWNLCAGATPSPAKLPSCTVCGTPMEFTEDAPSPAREETPPNWMHHAARVINKNVLRFESGEIEADPVGWLVGIISNCYALADAGAKSSQGPAREETPATIEKLALKYFPPMLVPAATNHYYVGMVESVNIGQDLNQKQRQLCSDALCEFTELADAGARSVVVATQTAKCMTADDFSEQWRKLKQVHAKFSTRCIDDMFASYWAEIEHLMEAYAKHCTLAGVAALPSPPSEEDVLIDDTPEAVAATAYQILGVLAHERNCVPVRILDYFSAVAQGERPINPLPFNPDEVPAVPSSEETKEKQ